MVTAVAPEGTLARPRDRLALRPAGVWRLSVGLDDEMYRRARRRSRRRPVRWLKWRERAIVRRRPCPSTKELAELAAIRHELKVRGRWP
jgi:hypothetical protein